MGKADQTDASISLGEKHTIDDQEFLSLVERDLHREATDEERELLEWDRERWLVCLNRLVLELDTRLGSIKADLQEQRVESIAAEREYPEQREAIKDSWFAYESEVNARLARIKRFRMRVVNRVHDVKLSIKQSNIAQRRPKGPPKPKGMVGFYLRQGYSDGFQAALRQIEYLIVDGATVREALDACFRELLPQIRAWRDDPDGHLSDPPKLDQIPAKTA